ncbi:type 1 glutamine amidotransferase [Xylocopilactobacillus apicola]|uniref:Lipid II isoglutaminyl synthase (glutamine-hydrolyzing) subunit GatD n=1 Tax=Xylocopilactobacillus apicola TaxID=2932184 RepID=A0AAU9D6K9_9LACO|nr:glutamine amidotransferase [Xylocopilactobacillus apicola]BDR57920.1 adenosylcobyric acid synthase [Xylocopilactobacillus apicola]
MDLTIKIAHLYGNMMNTYGDYGNIVALRYYAKQLGIAVNDEVVSIGDPLEISQYDFMLFGGGQDYEEKVLAPDFQSKAKHMKDYIENDGPMLAVCGGYQMLGDYFLMANGERIEGIKALPHYTLNQPDGRFIGDIEIENITTGEKYHGFENHQGRTFLGSNESPLGNVVTGNGNNGEDGTEGAIYRNVFGTYFHGPILTRNGNLAKRILEIILTRKDPVTDWALKLKNVPAEFF